MKQGVGILIFMLLLSVSGIAQKYSTAVGLRMGNGRYGISAKQRILRSLAAEGIVSVGNQEVVGTVLLQKHIPLLGRGFNMYIGGGAHLGGLKDYGPIMGVDAMVGLEMKVPFLPFTASVDFKPAYHIIHEDWFDMNTAVSVRYIVGKDKKKQRQRARKKRRRRRERRKEREERREIRDEKRQDQDDQTFWENIGFPGKNNDGSRD
jgi:hypothetical protein